jgi:hypothetical protein
MKTLLPLLSALQIIRVINLMIATSVNAYGAPTCSELSEAQFKKLVASRPLLSEAEVERALHTQARLRAWSEEKIGSGVKLKQFRGDDRGAAGCYLDSTHQISISKRLLKTPLYRGQVERHEIGHALDAYRQFAGMPFDRNLLFRESTDRGSFYSSEMSSDELTQWSREIAFQFENEIVTRKGLERMNPNQSFPLKGDLLDHLTLLREEMMDLRQEVVEPLQQHLQMAREVLKSPLPFDVTISDLQAPKAILPFLSGAQKTVYGVDFSYPSRYSSNEGTSHPSTISLEVYFNQPETVAILDQDWNAITPAEWPNIEKTVRDLLKIEIERAQKAVDLVMPRLSDAEKSLREIFKNKKVRTSDLTTLRSRLSRMASTRTRIRSQTVPIQP